MFMLKWLLVVDDNFDQHLIRTHFAEFLFFWKTIIFLKFNFFTSKLLMLLLSNNVFLSLFFPWSIMIVGFVLLCKIDLVSVI